MITETGTLLLKLAASDENGGNMGAGGSAGLTGRMRGLYGKGSGMPMGEEAYLLRREARLRLDELGVPLVSTRNRQEDEQVGRKGGFALSVDRKTGMPKEVLHLPTKARHAPILKTTGSSGAVLGRNQLSDAFGFAHECLEAEEAAKSKGRRTLDHMCVYRRMRGRSNPALHNTYSGGRNEFGLGKYYHDAEGNRYRLSEDHTNINVLVNEARLMNMSPNALRRGQDGTCFLPLADSRRKHGIDSLLARALGDPRRTSVYGTELNDDDYSRIARNLYRHPGMKTTVWLTDENGNRTCDKPYSVRTYLTGVPS